MYDLSKPQRSIYEMEKYVGGSISVICGSMLVKGTKSPAELRNVVNQIYKVNDALRIHIVETKFGIQQVVTEFMEQEIEVLRFETKNALDLYANKYAKEPLNLYGNLCDIKILLTNDCYGILIKLHHIIGDAWSLAFICSQFNTILSGEIPTTHSYVSYLNKENLYLKGNHYLKDKTFFLEQFKECDDVTYLSGNASTSFDAARKTFILDFKQASILSTYADTRNVSLFVLFMTALAVYVNRVKMNVEHFYIGTAVLNRAGNHDKNTVGMFINNVPMLIRLDNNMSFAENLLNIRQSSFSVLRHQRYHYSDILMDIRKEYHFSEKLYDVVLSYQNATITGSDANCESTWYHNGMQTESLQIHIDDRDKEGIFRMHYDYQTEKYTENEIVQMHNQITNLLFDAIANEQKKIYDLEIFSATEKQKILYDFNNTVAEYSKNKCIHQLFEEQVVKTPNKTAVIARDKTLTYEKLNRQANLIAYDLIERGIGIGDVVAFILPRHSYLMAVIFGILKTGAAYMPIDIDCPQDRINYMLKDSRAKLCIIDKTFENLFVNTVLMDSKYLLVQNMLHMESLKKCKAGNPFVMMTSENLCYCIYTSGSTGKPKGVLVLHRNLVNLCTVNEKNIYQATAISQDKVLLSTAKCCFDAFAIDYALFLLNGNSIVLADDSDLTNSAQLAGLATKYRVEVLQSTPSAIKALCTNNAYVKMLGQIKVLILAAEKFTPNLYSLLKTITNADIFNGYGPSETTVGASIGKIHSGNIHIGKPIANVQIYIVDKFMCPLPIGVTGEICVAGAGVGAGYLNRPELTDEKFIENPFGMGKLYKTGDLAYWQEDGNITYVGRNDFQVKIRGLRIELEEIEKVICNVEGILQSAVITRTNDDGRQFICAFYAGKEVAPEEIRNTISKVIPVYMIPSVFIYLDSMPLTASGKINIKELTEYTLPAIPLKKEYILPQTEPEKALIKAIETILGMEQISVTDNFFELGGDSLKAIELIARMEDDGFYTDAKMIFSCNTIRELAQMLDTEIKDTFSSHYIGDIPATPAQMRIYTAQNIQDDLTTYNVPYVFRTQNINKDNLQQAIRDLIKRHEIFRTHFENKDGTIIQIIEENVSFTLERIADGNLSTFIRPFDLSRAPLLRVGYYDDMVAIDMHHIITDGGSIPVFFHELNELYMGRHLKTVPVPYYQFAMEKVDYTESEKYWLSIYDGELPTLELRTDYGRNEKRSFKGNVLYDFIELSLHHKIIKKCKDLNITPYVFYMSGFYILLSKFSGNEDIIVGMPISGRMGKFLNTIGMFVNTIAFRSRPIGTKSLQAFLEEVKDASANAIIYQNYPYGELIKKLGINTTERNPLFDVMFTYQNEKLMQLRFADQNIVPLAVPITASKYDFTFNIMPRESSVVIMAEYCTELYKESTIQRFIESYRFILTQMLDESVGLKDISAVSAQEMHKIKFDFNNTAINYPKHKCIHHLFEEQVQKTPDDIAVIACDRTLTYMKLNEQANSVAYNLNKRGVKTGDIIAFALPRRSYLIAIMLGILKSGAAYMPIDLEYPQERIDYMLNDSKAKIFITDEMIEELLNNEKPDNFISEATYKDICYCIYTSGTTGKPKGILICHRNVANFIQDNDINTFQHSILHNCSHIVCANSISFDITLQEIYLPLLNGKSIILLSDEQMYNIATATELFKEKQCGLIITPTKLNVYMSDESFCNSMKDITFIMCGAEVFSQQLLRKIKKHSKAIIYNGYGPTETTCGVLYSQINDEDNITIGQPIANTQIHILDQYLRLTPIGVIGELCIAGDNVGAGYLNRKELTSQKFIDNPFGKGKLYKTGDLAYWKDDGSIVYVGRNDFQVKIHGLRIELEEIENAISTIDGIVHVAVVARKDNDGQSFLCAFYTEDKSISIENIKTILRGKLPRYMIPHAFACLDQMPLMPNGKINRRNLPEVDLKPIGKDVEYVKPEGAIEKQIVATMEQILNYMPISCDDDFFDLGCDSLSAIEFVSKMHSDGIYFTLQNVYDYPTARKLFAHITSDNCQRIYLKDMDFTQAEEVLRKNEIKYITMPQKKEIGSLLLAGATGYLGIHILDNFLEYNNGIVYCLVRGKTQSDSEKRLKELLEFYFDDKYKNTPRIRTICGDLQKERFGLPQSEYSQLLSVIDTVINAAASVKHYGSYQYFYEINVEAVKRLIDFCFESHAKLIHTSTLGVSGNSFADSFDGYTSETEKHFYESSLYIGQPLDNVYARSKFEAEKLILENMQRGLCANIMRLGNLTNRFCDGAFQKNHETNAFLMRIKAILEMGIFPDYLMNLYLEFTPIDEAAMAIMTIVRYFNTEQTVFHINSTKVVYMDKLLCYFQQLECPLKVVSGTEFTKALRKTIEQNGQEYIFETFINDMDADDHLNYDSNIRIENAFTTKYLKQLGFEWSDIGIEYLKKYITYFRKINYWEV